MNTFGLAGIFCWCLMSLAFAGTGTRVRTFNFICAFLVVLVLAVYISGARTIPGVDAIAVMTGFVLYWGGLLLLRVMLSRSVSLHMLVCYSRGQHEPTIDDHIAGRLDDALKYHLVVANADHYTLSRSGVVVDFFLTGLYQVVGARK